MSNILEQSSDNKLMLEKPQLIYQIHVERTTHIRRFFWNLLVVVGAFGAWVALETASLRNIPIDPVLLQVGKVVALGVTAMFAVRGIFGLIRGLRRRNEFARFYDRGFTWRYGKQENKYTWAQLKSFREGVRQLRIGRIVLGQIGAHTLTTSDDKVYKVTPVHGNPRHFANTVRPYIADVMGERMGRALRNNKTIRLHPRLLVTPAGIQTGKYKIRWSELDVTAKRGRLQIKQKNRKGRFKTVASFGVHQIDNLGGFMEIATSTIKNHQPERFNIKTQGLNM